MPPKHDSIRTSNYILFLTKQRQYLKQIARQHEAALEELNKAKRIANINYNLVKAINNKHRIFSDTCFHCLTHPTKPPHGSWKIFMALTHARHINLHLSIPDYIPDSYTSDPKRHYLRKTTTQFNGTNQRTHVPLSHKRHHGTESVTAIYHLDSSTWNPNCDKRSYNH